MMSSPIDTAVYLDTPPDAAVPWHYGDPLREQRILESAAGVVDRSNRPVLTVGGPDRLQLVALDLLPAHLSELADGDSTQVLVLSPHGHVEQHWQLSDLGGQVWIDSEPGTAAIVLQYLEGRCASSKRVEPRVDMSADYAVLSVRGPRTGAVLAAAGLPQPAPGTATGLVDGGFVRTDRGPPGRGGADLSWSRARHGDDLLELLARHGAPACGSWA